MDSKKIQDLKGDLIHEIELNDMQAEVYLLVTVNGRMTPRTISERLEIPLQKAQNTAESLISLGGFIEYGNDEYEAMHPRFTAVNMYRRKCEKRGVPFGRNKIVDNIGVILEEPYDNARGNP